MTVLYLETSALLAWLFNEALAEQAKGRINEADLIVTELTHVETDRFLEWAKTVPDSLILITHLGNPDEVALLQVAIQMAGLENVTLAEDGLQLEF